MGKSNSKLKPEVVEELTRKTYCEYRPWQVENRVENSEYIPSI